MSYTRSPTLLAMPRIGAGRWHTSGEYWGGRLHSVKSAPRDGATAWPRPGLNSVMTPADTAALMLWGRVVLAPDAIEGLAVNRVVSVDKQT